MNKITVLSWNSRGLNSPQKRISTLEQLFRKDVHFAFIQETHFLKTDVHRFQNKNYQVIASSCFDKKSKGVLIAAKRNLNYSILGTGGSDDGRIAFCKIIYDGVKIALICAYAPNCFDQYFYDSLASLLLDLSEFELLIGGDFNAVWLHEIDRTGVTESRDQQLSSKALRELAADHGLVDIWRVMNPSSRDFSFYSACHKTFSRIDYVLASSTLFSNIDSTTLCPSLLSDHRMVLCTFLIRPGQPRAPRWRFNTSLLQNNVFITELEAELKDFIFINSASVDDPRALWDAIKGCIRNKTVSFASNLNKNRKRRIDFLETEIAAIEQSMLNDMSPENMNKRQKLLDELNSFLRQKTELIMHRTRQNYYINSARPSRLLALKLRANNQLANIATIRTEEGSLTSDPVKINDTFKAFFQKLYTSEVGYEENICNDF